MNSTLIPTTSSTPKQEQQITVKRPHLTQAQRAQIESELNLGISLKQIASNLGKHHSTISREIQKHSIPSDKGAFGRITNRCIHRHECNKTQCCLTKPDCTRKCASCTLCNAVCREFVEEQCRLLNRPPYVCNGCANERFCVLKKRYYKSRKAHEQYHSELVSKRCGVTISYEELVSIGAILAPRLKKGQSIHNIVVTEPDLFTYNERTIYNFVNTGLVPGCGRADLVRAVYIKPRRRKGQEHKVDRQCTVGRKYTDFIAHITQHPGVPVIEMDSVIGHVGGKVLLTLFFPRSGFLLAYLRDHNNARSVTETFIMLNNMLREHTPSIAFGDMFPIILTDNGSEFSDPSSIEGLGDSKVFYCDPMNSNQKAQIERDHEELRRILPKGSSFDNFTQEDINLALSHINSYCRPIYGDVAPIDLFAAFYGSHLPNLFGIRKIPPREVLLKPELLIK